MPGKKDASRQTTQMRYDYTYTFRRFGALQPTSDFDDQIVPKYCSSLVGLHSLATVCKHGVGLSSTGSIA